MTKMVKRPFISEKMKEIAKENVLVKKMLDQYITNHIPYETTLEMIIERILSQT